MSGPFIPDHFVSRVATGDDIKIVAIAWGFTLGFGFLTSSKALKQSRRIWKRSHKINTYVILVWTEIISSLIISIMAWLLSDNIMPMKWVFIFSARPNAYVFNSFYALFVSLVCWSLQVQALLQIIINRVGLLIIDKRKVWRLKWSVAALMTVVNISVFVIWIPAQLQVNETFIKINYIYDRIEKAIFLFVDLCLNIHFLWLVRSELISAGMTKYMQLFKFNASIIFISISMDILIISMMELKNPWIYTQFQALAYIVKLNIELTMASTIAKVAKKPGSLSCSSDRRGKRNSTGTEMDGVNRHSQIQFHADPLFTTSMNGDDKAWVDRPEAQIGARQQHQQRRKISHPDDIEALSESDDSFDPENTPDADSTTRKTTKWVVTTESVELRTTPNLSASNRNLNRDFPRQDLDNYRTEEVKHEGTV